MQEKIKIAGLQLGAYKGSYEENMEEILKLAEQVVQKEQPDLIVCSELMTAPYFAAVSQTDDSFFSYAEFIDGPTVATIKELAYLTKTHIIGTFFEKEIKAGVINYYNTAFVCSPTRGLIGSYRKVHVPKVETASMKTDEKYYFERLGGGGEDFPVFILDTGWKLGVLICFDRSFPEAWRSLALQGADLVVVPTATYGFRKDLYVEELRVRALENNVYVLGVNKAGSEQLPGEEMNRTHFGLSCLISPFGDKLSAATEAEWSYVSGEADVGERQKSKNRVDWLAERKVEVYNKYMTESRVFSEAE